MNNPDNPEYRLAALPAADSEKPPGVLAIQRNPTHWRRGRREFLQTTAIGLGAFLSGCGGSSGNGSKGNDTDSVFAFCSAQAAALVGVANLAFSPNGRYLASSGRMLEDNQFKLWEMPSGRLLISYGLQSTGRFIAVAFSPDNTVVAAFIWDRIIVFDLASGNLIQDIDTGTQIVGAYTLAFSPDGSTLAVADEDQTITLWDLATETAVGSFATGQSLFAIAYNADGSLLAAATGNDAENFAVKIFNMPAGTLAATAVDPSDPHIAAVNQVSFTPDGRTLVTSSYDLSIKFWDVASGALILTLGVSDFTSGYEAHFVDSVGKLYAARKSFEEPRMEIRSIPDAVLERTIEDLDGTSLAVSPDRTLLAVAETSPRIPDYQVNTIRMWRLDRNEFQNCLFDAKATRSFDTPATRFEVRHYAGRNADGQEIMYSVPCEQPLPAGATCECNCVEGEYAPDFGGPGPCGINFICTCIPVFYR